jgi:hypothetical protein
MLHAYQKREIGKKKRKKKRRRRISHVACAIILESTDYPPFLKIN